MISQRIRPAIVLCFLLLSGACHKQQESAIEGSVVPPCPGVHITIIQSGKTVRTADANAQDGKFRIALVPGRYDISISTPSSPFPASFIGITVDRGKTSMIPSVEIAQRSGSATLSGTVLPAPTGSTVTLLYEGRERAVMNTAPDGKFEFTGLSAGTYTIMASSPGYESDKTEARIFEDRNASLNMRLLFISEISGVDWGRETIRARGRGMYPANITNHTVMHEMAKRAALSDAERNLLAVVEQIKLDPNHDVRSFMTENRFTAKISGFLKGFSIVSEQEVNGGVEVELELPLTGISGLTRYLTD